MTTNHNVILITVDSLRSDFIGHLNNKSNLTPRIDKLADTGISCTKAYANGIPTYFAFRSILGGRYDLTEEMPIGLPREWNTLADVFASQGYNTAAFNAANPWLTREYNYDSGFDVFVDHLTKEPNDDLGKRILELMKAIQHRIPDEGVFQDKMGLAARMFCSLTNNYPLKSADVITNEALGWLENRSQEDPFFLWVHYMDPHYPWTPVSKNAPSWEIAQTWHDVAHTYNNSDKQPDESILDNVRKLYAQEVSNVDSAVDRIYTHLEKTGLKENTVICFTADHGTELGDHGGFSHGPDSLYEEIVHIPLVFSGPNISSKYINKPVQHVDIPLTIADFSNISGINENINVEWAGDSIANQQRDSAFVQVFYDFNPAKSMEVSAAPLYALIEYPWKLHWNKELGEIELYDLETDPHEKFDLSSINRQKAKKLKEKIEGCRKETIKNRRTAAEITRIKRVVNNKLNRERI